MREDMVLLMAASVVLILVFTMSDVFGPGPPHASNAADLTPPGEPGYTYEEEELCALSGHTDEDSSTNVDFVIEGSNIVGVLVVLEWTDDIGNNDQFTLTVLIGGQERAAVSGATGRLELEINDTPAGDHSIVVEATKCPGLFGRRLTKLDLDRGNDWALTVTGMSKAPLDEEAGRA
jgi:hypothetical protein